VNLCKPYLRHGTLKYINYHLKNKVSITPVFNPLSTSTNQEVFEKQLCNQSSQYEKCRKFSVTNGKPSHATTESTLFPVSKDEWNIKHGTGKSMKNALYVLWHASRAEAISNSDKIKRVALV